MNLTVELWAPGMHDKLTLEAPVVMGTVPEWEWKNLALRALAHGTRWRYVDGDWHETTITTSLDPADYRWEHITPQELSDGSLADISYRLDPKPGAVKVAPVTGEERIRPGLVKYWRNSASAK